MTRWGSRLVPFLVAAVFVGIGARGLDFGAYWDEDSLVGKVEWSVTSGGVLLPPAYDWPSASYWVAVAALAPELRSFAGFSPEALSRWERSLVPALDSAGYRLRLRWLFLLLTALSVIWVFAATRALGGTLVEASTAAAILASAWEPGYHARFPSPDGLLMQFGALTLWCTIMAAQRPYSGWVLAAAAAAGLAVGAKYNAWPLLVPVLAIAWRFVPADVPVARRVATVGVTALGAFVVTTPGAILMPARFAQALVQQWRHYATGHGVHTIDGGLDHLWRMGEYIALELLSPFPVLAVMLLVLAVLGGWRLATTSRWIAVAAVGFPILYILYLAMHRVMMARNVIILAPFLAVAAARGMSAINTALPGRLARLAAVGVVWAAIAANTAYAASAATTIVQRHTVDFGEAARTWLLEGDARQTAVSPGVIAALGPAIGSLPPLASASTAERWLTFTHEPVCGRPIPANMRRLITLITGPREVNLTRYPDWGGDPHLVVIDLGRLRREGLCEAM